MLAQFSNSGDCKLQDVHCHQIMKKVSERKSTGSNVGHVEQHGIQIKALS